MSKNTLEITETAVDKTYRDGCDDVKRVLKNLFPDYEFEEKTELRCGQIYKHNDAYVLLWRLNGEGTKWVSVYLNNVGHTYPCTTEETLKAIQEYDYTLCPNAKIIVKEE